MAEPISDGLIPIARKPSFRRERVFSPLNCLPKTRSRFRVSGYRKFDFAPIRPAHFPEFGQPPLTGLLGWSKDCLPRENSVRVLEFISIQSQKTPPTFDQRQGLADR